MRLNCFIHFVWKNMKSFSCEKMFFEATIEFNHIEFVNLHMDRIQFNFVCVFTFFQENIHTHTKLNWIRSIWKLTYSIWLNSIATSKKHFLTWKAFSYYFTHAHQMDEANSFFLFSSHSNAIISQIKGYRTITLEMVCFSFKTTPLFNVSTFKNHDLRNLQPFVLCFTIYWLYCFLILTWKSRCKKKTLTFLPIRNQRSKKSLLLSLLPVFTIFTFLVLYSYASWFNIHLLNLSLLLDFLNKPFLIRKTVFSEFVACFLKNFHLVALIWN
jgi:hypothetical protein